MMSEDYPLLVKGPSTNGAFSDTWSWALIDIDSEGREWVIRIRFHDKQPGGKAEFGKRPKHWIEEYKTESTQKGLFE